VQTFLLYLFCSGQIVFQEEIIHSNILAKNQLSHYLRYIDNIIVNKSIDIKSGLYISMQEKASKYRIFTLKSDPTYCGWEIHAKSEDYANKSSKQKLRCIENKPSIRFN
jgi:hypothetical protein